MRWQCDHYARQDIITGILFLELSHYLMESRSHSHKNLLWVTFIRWVFLTYCTIRHFLFLFVYYNMVHCTYRYVELTNSQSNEGIHIRLLKFLLELHVLETKMLLIPQVSHSKSNISGPSSWNTRTVPDTSPVYSTSVQTLWLCTFELHAVHFHMQSSFECQC